MDTGLFRPQAVKQQAAKLDGEVIIAQPLGSKILLTALLMVVGVIVVFLITSSFHRKETVTGYLHPNMGLSKVVSPRAGNIEKVFVSNGDVVKAGDAVAIINIPNYLSQGDSVLAVLGESVKQQQNFTAMRRAQIELNFKQQSQDLTRQILLAEQSVTDAVSQQSLLTERKKIQQRRLNNLSTLVDSGAISDNDFQQQQEQLLATKQQLAELNVNYQNQMARVEQLRSQLSQLPTEHKQQLALIDVEQLRLDQQYAEVQSQGKLLLKSPIDGTVTNLVAKLGNAIKPQMPLATIVPTGAELKAVLLVPTRAYGFVESGQNTRIRFDAFPYQRFGLFEGEVKNAANAILLPGEVEMPVNIQEPVYRVEVALGEQEIRAYGIHVPLQPGMTLSADIVLEERSLISWLFEPILSLQGRI